MSKRSAEEVGAAAKAAKTSGVDPFKARKEIFAAEGLRQPDGYSGPHCWTLVAPGVGPFASSPPLELKYFAIRGLGQLPQLCMEVAGYPYEYLVVLSGHFKDELKPKLAFGRLPCVKTLGGMDIVQSKAIVRYVAKVCGLAGDTDDDAARCDMLYEMLQSEGKVDADEVKKLAEGGKSLTAADNLSTASRVEFAAYDDGKKTLSALKCWEDMLAGSKAKGNEWLVGGLGDAKSTKLCYVDIAMYWTLRTSVDALEKVGCPLLAQHVKKVGALEGMKRFFDSGRLMPNMGEGYKFVDDDLVKKA